MTQTRPRLLVIGGPNGAGKSTLALACAEHYRLPYLGADDIAAQINAAAPAAARVAAARVFSARLTAALGEGRSLVVESTLAGLHLARRISQAHERGYHVTLVLVFLDSPELCMRRVAQRVAAGGHDVPEQDIRRRYARSLRRFIGTYRTLADNWVVMFNGEASFETVAVGTGTEVTALYHEALWQQLQALAAGGDPDDED